MTIPLQLLSVNLNLIRPWKHQMQLYSSLRSNTTALSSVKPHAGWLFWDAPDLLFYSFTPCALSCENETLTSFISQLHAAVGGNLRARFGPVSPNLVCGHTQTTQSHPGKSDRQTTASFLLQVVWSDCPTENSYFHPPSAAPWTRSRRERSCEEMEGAVDYGREEAMMLDLWSSRQVWGSQDGK